MTDDQDGAATRGDASQSATGAKRPAGSTDLDRPARPQGTGGTVAFAYYLRLLVYHLRVGLREHRTHFLVATALFALGTLAGLAMALSGVNLLELLGFENLEEVFEGAELTVEFLFLNNSRVLAILVAGLLTLGLLTVLVLAFNGLLIGWVVGVAAGEVSLGLLFALLAPHGVLELPAFWLGAAVAFRFVHVVASYLRGTRDRFLTRPELGRMALVALLAWAMIGVAAVIEVHVTPAIAEAIYGSAETGAV